MNIPFPGINSIQVLVNELQVPPALFTEWVQNASGKTDIDTPLTPTEQRIVLYRLTELIAERCLVKDIIGFSYQLQVVDQQACTTDAEAIAIIDRFTQMNGIAFKPLAQMNTTELVQTCHLIKQLAPRLLLLSTHVKDYAELFSLHHGRKSADKLMQEVDYASLTGHYINQ